MSAGVLTYFLYLRLCYPGQTWDGRLISTPCQTIQLGNKIVLISFASAVYKQLAATLEKIAGIRQAELEQTIFLWSYLEWVVIISEFFAITSSRVMRQWTHEIFWNKYKSYIRMAACKMKRATIPSVRDMDFPILKVWTLEVWALKTHLLFGLALHSPAGVQCQHWES